jgi:solute carrier family 27 fatty acid transporter 1/4
LYISTGEPGVFVGKINPKKAISSFTGYADEVETKKKVICNVFSHGDQGFNSGKCIPLL